MQLWVDCHGVCVCVCVFIYAPIMYMYQEKMYSPYTKGT